MITLLGKLFSCNNNIEDNNLNELITDLRRRIETLEQRHQEILFTLQEIRLDIRMLNN